MILMGRCGGEGGTFELRGFSFRNFLSKPIVIGPIAIAALLVLASTLSFAAAQRGTLVHEETVRVAPDASAARVGDAARGHELIIIETSRDWVHVEAVIRDPNPEEGASDEEAE